MIIDTSDLSGRQLRERLYGAIGAPPSGSRHRAAAGQLWLQERHAARGRRRAWTCRFMENPFYIDRLRALNGLDEPRARIRPWPADHWPTLPGRRRGHLVDTVPGYEAEGKGRLTVAFGCTGGQHRSIAIVEEMPRAGAPESRARSAPGTASSTANDGNGAEPQYGNGDRRSGEDAAARAEASSPVERRDRALRRWLRPGIGIKRWLLVVFIGELLLALGRGTPAALAAFGDDGGSADSPRRRRSPAVAAGAARLHPVHGRSGVVRLRLVALAARRDRAIPGSPGTAGRDAVPASAARARPEHRGDRRRYRACRCSCAASRS